MRLHRGVNRGRWLHLSVCVVVFDRLWWESGRHILNFFSAVNSLGNYKPINELCVARMECVFAVAIQNNVHFTALFKRFFYV